MTGWGDDFIDGSSSHSDTSNLATLSQSNNNNRSAAAVQSEQLPKKGGDFPPSAPASSTTAGPSSFIGGLQLGHALAGMTTGMPAITAHPLF